MKKLNKFIALLLAVSICLSLMNMRVFAVDGENPGEITAPSTEDVNAGAAEQPDQTQIEEPEPILLRELEQAANDDADTTDNVPVTDDADTIGGVNDVDNIGHAENAEEEPLEMPAFSDSKTSANGVKVSVSADEGIFPAGTLLRVTDVSAYTALAAAEQALDAEVVDAVGVDISFLDADGQEIEPANKQLVNVNIRLPQALDGDEFTVIHKDDAGVVTQLLEADAAERTASFDAGEFSLYVVVGTENGVVRRTVNFYDGETLVATQIVKNGDTLLEPAVPEKANMAFLGWSADGGETYQKFGVVSDVDDSASVDETVNLYAQFAASFAVTFHDRNGNILRVVTGENGDTVSVEDVTFEVMANEYVSGWTTSADSTPDGAVGSSVTINGANIDLYPIVCGVSWVIFHRVGSDSDPTEATYTAPLYVRAGEAVPQPADPTRPGYTFKEWTTDAGGQSPYDFSKALNGNLILYGQWTPVQTSYQVLVWKETLVNGTYVEGNYTLGSHLEIPAYSGDTVSIDADSELIQRLNDDEEYQFHELDRMDADSAVVCGDGTTIINVYYKLKVFYVEFTAMPETLYERSGGIFLMVTDTGSGHYWWNVKDYVTITFTHNGVTYSNMEKYTIAARFGEDISDRWPSYASGTFEFTDAIPQSWKESMLSYGADKMDPYAWRPLDSNALTHSKVNHVTKVHTLTQSLMNDDGSDTVHLFLGLKVGVTYRDAYYWLENAEDDGFTASEKYSQQNLASTVNSVLHAKALDGFSFYNPDDEYDAPEGYSKSDLASEHRVYHFYYYRNRYSLFFYNYNGIEKEYTGDNAVKYEAGIEKYNYTPERPSELSEAYRFSGWYTTMDCLDGTEFSFDGAVMPMSSLTLYAKWSVPDVTVTFNSNGGSAVASQTIFYGSKATEPAAPAREGYTFGGWVRTTSPFNFTTRIYADTELTARWLDSAVINVVYDANGGSGAPADGNTYMDVSKARILTAPKEIPENKYFHGWELGDALYRPGELLTVLSSDSVKVRNNQYVITLVAKYGDMPADTSVIFDPNGGTGTQTELPVMNNGTVTVFVPSDLGFYRSGYIFVEWNTAADGNGTAFQPGGTVAADVKAPVPNTLYAIWKPVQRTATWVDYDGTVLYGPETFNVLDGAPGSDAYPGAIPARPDVVDGDTTIRYSFTGWETRIDNEGNVIYVAQYDETIDTPEDDDDNTHLACAPKTGDERNAALWIALASLSAAGLTFILGGKRKDGE